MITMKGMDKAVKAIRNISSQQQGKNSKETKDILDRIGTYGMTKAKQLAPKDTMRLIQAIRYVTKGSTKVEISSYTPAYMMSRKNPFYYPVVMNTTGRVGQHAVISGDPYYMRTTLKLISTYFKSQISSIYIKKIFKNYKRL